MKIGDKVSFTDKTYFRVRQGIIKKFSDDGTKAMVSVTGKFTKEWISIDDLTLVNEQKSA